MHNYEAFINYPLMLQAMKCRICKSNLIKFLSLGSMPLANSFLSKEDINKEEDFWERRRADFYIDYC